MLPVPVEVLSSTALFLTLWGLLGYILKPFIILIIEREFKTEGRTKEAFRHREHAQDRLTQYNEAMYQARLSGFQIRESIIAKARAEADKLIEEASLLASEKLMRAREEINRLKLQARTDAQAEIVTFARQLHAKALEQGLH